MKYFILNLALLFSSLSNASDKEILVNVVFNNFSAKKFTSGKLIIIDSNKHIVVNSIAPFTITLPKKGRYKFLFKSDDFSGSLVYYPARITKKRNKIVIKILESFDNINNSKTDKPPSQMPIFDPYNIDEKVIEEKYTNNTLNFRLHGINNIIPKSFNTFKKTYGVGFVYENCLVDLRTSKYNKAISEFLTEKYGDKWKIDLPTKPFGFK